MRCLQQCGTLLHTKVGSNEQHSGSTTQAGLEQLVLVDDEVLIEDGDIDTTVTSHLDKLITTAKVLLVSKDAQC